MKDGKSLKFREILGGLSGAYIRELYFVYARIVEDECFNTETETHDKHSVNMLQEK